MTDLLDVGPALNDQGDLIISCVLPESQYPEALQGLSEFNQDMLISAWTHTVADYAIKEMPDVLVDECRITDAFDDFEFLHVY